STQLDCVITPPHSTTPFPYTTLFRSPPARTRSGTPAPGLCPPRPENPAARPLDRAIPPGAGRPAHERRSSARSPCPCTRPLRSSTEVSARGEQAHHHGNQRTPVSERDTPARARSRRSRGDSGVAVGLGGNSRDAAARRLLPTIFSGELRASPACRSSVPLGQRPVTPAASCRPLA